MVAVVNTFGALIALSIFVMFIYLFLYFILFLTGKILGKQLLNNTLLKILYILTSLPFLFCGFYIFSLIFVIDYYENIKVLMALFGLFLVLFSIYRVMKKIKDIEYFGGV